ncbi:hypothetical protein DPMN_194717 [Dreissena polymorpha]|uniref:Uncharacterized protein n=1 Tax=Dreissena polymorpha TaxID=45954 RepID=A0A9D4BC48_DREPO|nr:hypothetical protein DPMN_194717 [Dreissena polymorpha]
MILSVPIACDRLMRVASMTAQTVRQSYKDNGSANRVLSSAEGGINDRSDGPAVISG